MRRIVLVYGLVAGAILSAMMIVSMLLIDRIGFDHGMLIGYTTMVVAFLMVWFGVRAYRDRVAGGRIGFGRAFLVGLAITAVATVCYVATWQVVYWRFMPDFGDRYAIWAVEKARRSGASEAELAKTAAEMAEFKAMYRNPLVNVALTALEPLPVGLVFALVTAGAASRKRREPALRAA